MEDDASDVRHHHVSATCPYRGPAHPLHAGRLGQPAREEEVWPASPKSREARQAYAGDVRRCMRLFGITAREALRQVDRTIMMAYARHLREVQRVHPTTIRRRLSALSSLFRHLVQFQVIAANLVQAIDRPAINRWQGMTPPSPHRK